MRTDRKVTYGKWARGTGPAPGAAVGPGAGVMGLGGLSDGDVVAENLDLAAAAGEDDSRVNAMLRAFIACAADLRYHLWSIAAICLATVQLVSGVRHSKNSHWHQIRGSQERLESI